MPDRLQRLRYKFKADRGATKYLEHFDPFSASQRVQQSPSVQEWRSPTIDIISIMSEPVSTNQPAGHPAAASVPPAAAAPAAMTSSVPAAETMTYAERRMSGQVAFGYDTGRRRTSSFGAYTRVVVVAVDPSDHSKLAFDCKQSTSSSSSSSFISQNTHSYSMNTVHKTLDWVPRNGKANGAYSRPCNWIFITRVLLASVNSLVLRSIRTKSRGNENRKHVPDRHPIFDPSLNPNAVLIFRYLGLSPVYFSENSL